MAVPAALQRYANDVVKGAYIETSKLRAACQTKNSDLAAEIKKLPMAGRLDSRILEALRRVHDTLREGAANGNNRGHRTAPKAVPPRGQLKAVPLRVRASPPMSELRLLDVDSIIVDENGSPVPTFAADQMSCDSVGVAFASEKTAAVAIYHYLQEDTFDEICSLVCKSTLLETASSKRRKDIEKR